MQLYHVINTARSSKTRALRAAAPVHRGMVQFLLNKRIVRGRATVFTKDELESVLDKVTTMKACGLVDVVTPDGRKVDLTTFEAAPPPKAPPLPHPPPDDVRNDKPSGGPMPIYEDGVVQEVELAKTTPAPSASADEDKEVEYHEGASKAFKKTSRRRGTKR